MVLIFLNALQFEAEKFETRTMPTPNLKGKEMIYWIRVDTKDKRLLTELQTFLKGVSKFIDLKVPSTFISAQTELESYRISTIRDGTEEESTVEGVRAEGGETVQGGGVVDSFRVEIILRRTLSETATKPAQSPYG
ncbi:MAG: hypothetical protein M1368_03490 [Thaumarchaeota archaeon]|nr:hypothetical protein [Nitrososphaerota archaeon]